MVISRASANMSRFCVYAVAMCAVLRTCAGQKHSFDATAVAALKCKRGAPPPEFSFVPAKGAELAPPVLSTTLRRHSQREIYDPLHYDRTSSLHNATFYSFVHISKCSGASFIKWARGKDNIRFNGQPTFKDFFPQNAQGQEIGNMYDLHKRPHYVRLTFVRSPRSHVMSLFKECRFDHWGMKIIRSQEEKGLKAVPHAGSHLEDFTEWVDYFVAGNDTYGFGCYNPWNYQSRALLSTSPHPHSIGPCSNDFEPSADGAVAEMIRFSWVGLQDFYHESICLLMARIDTRHPYLQTCACSADGRDRVEEAQSMDLHVDHTPGNSEHISSNLDLDALTTAKVDRLTVVDRYMFGVALRGFMSEIVDLEARLGRRVMCAATLDEARSKLAYIADPVALYELTRSGMAHP